MQCRYGPEVDRPVYFSKALYTGESTGCLQVDSMELVGFIGLGIMGEPMARNLIRAGTPLIAWNRSAQKADAMSATGAFVASTPAELFQRTRVVILMLAGSDAIDAVLRRGTPDFAWNVAQRTIVHMGTTSPEYSRALEADIRAAGGSYVEAPVSGSRQPAQDGTLVAMLAGEREAVEFVRPILRPICLETYVCGAVPNATLMKLAVNLCLFTMVVGLAESVHFASRNGVNMQQFLEILETGPMANSVARVKSRKMVSRDFTIDASIRDALKINELIAEAARASHTASPLLDVCRNLYRQMVEFGCSPCDMAAVIHAIEDRSVALERAQDVSTV